MSRVLVTTILVSLFNVFLVSAAQASVFGEHIRGGDGEGHDKYPKKLVINRFSEAQVGDMTCEWEHAGSFDVKTDRGNYSITSFLVSPSAVKVMCEGKRPFYVFDLPPRYLDAEANDGDVGVWFGKFAERDGCQGYSGCDKVHVLKMYSNAENIAKREHKAEALEEW